MKCDVKRFPHEIGSGITQRYTSPETKAEADDSFERARTILKNHDRFSSQVVFAKVKGSTYPDMADIFSTTENECKRVYWHDINHLRQQMAPILKNLSQTKGRTQK